MRWGIICVAIIFGTLGLVSAVLGTTQFSLIGGWGLAETSYSGAIVVLRTLLVGAQQTHRQRSSVVLIVMGYVGMFVPIVLLIAIPGSMWTVTFGFAAASIAMPLIVLFRPFRADREPSPTSTSAAVAAPPVGRTGARFDGAHRPNTVHRSGTAHRLPAWVLLLVQCASMVAISAFLSFQSLDLPLRLGATDEPAGGAGTVPRRPTPSSSARSCSGRHSSVARRQTRSSGSR